MSGLPKWQPQSDTLVVSDGAATPRTLWTSRIPDTNTVQVSVGRIANLPLTIGGVELGAGTPPALTITTSGVVYIRGVFGATASGVPAAFTILNAASVPANTSTLGHKILAEVTLSDGVLTVVNPVVWNLSDAQKCGVSTYLWGGFGA